MQVEVDIAEERNQVRASADEEDFLGGEELDLEQQENDEGVERNAEDVHHCASDIFGDLLGLDDTVCGVKEAHSRLLRSQR